MISLSFQFACILIITEPFNLLLLHHIYVVSYFIMSVDGGRVPVQQQLNKQPRGGKKNV